MNQKKKKKLERLLELKSKAQKTQKEHEPKPENHHKKEKRPPEEVLLQLEALGVHLDLEQPPPDSDVFPREPEKLEGEVGSPVVPTLPPVVQKKTPKTKLDS